MLVSIITVVYNGVDTIEKSILSVLNQSYKEIEYIIIDGDSNDGTKEIVLKYSDNLRHFISEPDSGLYEAMNKGINLASGELIGLLNSDDVFFSEFVIQDVVDFHSIRRLDCSIGNVVQVNANDLIIREYSSRYWKPFKLKIGLMPPHPSIFITRKVLQEYGGYSLDYTIASDYDLLIRYFLNHKVNWAYSGITTTSMLVGGISSSGINSYRLISLEIFKALRFYGIKHLKFLIHLRFIWKLFEIKIFRWNR
jgi:glycosyltransferase involved in cell wall biosynthesis